MHVHKMYTGYKLQQDWGQGLLYSPLLSSLLVDILVN